METKSNIILADSSGLISLLIETDHNYSKATTIAGGLVDQHSAVFIPSEVLAETLNILGKKYGHAQAARFLEGLLQSVIFVVKPSSDIARDNALSIFKTEIGSVSYTDCLVMAMADVYGTVEIFGFDEIFTKRGYFLPMDKRSAA